MFFKKTGNKEILLFRRQKYRRQTLHKIRAIVRENHPNLWRLSKQHSHVCFITSYTFSDVYTSSLYERFPLNAFENSARKSGTDNPTFFSIASLRHERIRPSGGLVKMETNCRRRTAIYRLLPLFQVILGKRMICWITNCDALNGLEEVLLSRVFQTNVHA